jgi:hypothetical protein
MEPADHLLLLMRQHDMFQRVNALLDPGTVRNVLVQVDGFSGSGFFSANIALSFHFHICFGPRSRFKVEHQAEVTNVLMLQIAAASCAHRERQATRYGVDARWCR